MISIDSRSHLWQVLDYFNLPRIIVEVGTAEGRFSKEIYDWGVEKLYLVDLFEHTPIINGCASFEQKWHDNNYKIVKELEANSNGVIEVLKGFSHKVAQQIPDKSISMVYVDADHTFQGCFRDTYAWLPKICENGIIAFHDFYNKDYGVQKAVVQFAVENNFVVNIINEMAVEDAGAWIQIKHK